MHDELKRLIRSRAERIGRLAAELLLYSVPRNDATEALKWSCLVLRRPRAYLERFRGCDLSIDVSLLESFVWARQEHLFGSGHYQLLPEEREIIEIHNSEVDRLDKLSRVEELPHPRIPLAPAPRLQIGRAP